MDAAAPVALEGPYAPGPGTRAEVKTRRSCHLEAHAGHRGSAAHCVLSAAVGMAPLRRVGPKCLAPTSILCSARSGFATCKDRLAEHLVQNDPIKYARWPDYSSGPAIADGVLHDGLLDRRQANPFRAPRRPAGIDRCQQRRLATNRGVECGARRSTGAANRDLSRSTYFLFDSALAGWCGPSPWEQRQLMLIISRSARAGWRACPRDGLGCAVHMRRSSAAVPLLNIDQHRITAPTMVT